MESRPHATQQDPGVYQAMRALNTEIAKGVDPALNELIKIRASQINGCAYCLDMHTLDARAAGETEQRIYALNAWRETPFFTDRERAALALTEAVTLVHDGQVPDAVYDEAARHFEPAELAALVWAIAAINVWNRVAISGRSVPGSYQPRQAQH